jgi:hypothetical protein
MGNEPIPCVLMPSSMPDPGVVKWFVSGRERFGQEGCFFNSELTTRDGFAGNATLTIYLRLYLIKRDRAQDMSPAPLADGGDPVEVVPWGTPTNSGTAYNFAEFSRKVKEQAEKFWDSTNFCLIPPPDYRALEYSDGSQKMRPNIDCRFKIVWAEGPQDAHAVIDCFCPVRPHIFRSHVVHKSAGALGGQWTCYDLTASSGDITIPGTCMETVGDPLGDMTIKAVRCNKELSQEAVCHEVGHLLGLSHVGKFFKTPECLAAPDAGASACYRGPTDRDTANIMGAGDKLAAWNAMPWASRTISHTGIGLQGWRVNGKRVSPLRV